MKSSLLITILVILFAIFIVETTQQEQNHQRRILGAKKDKYCKDLFIKEQKEDPNGKKYDSEQIVTPDERKNAESIRKRLQFARGPDEAKKDIKKMLNENDYQGYLQSLMTIAIPFIVLLALAIIGSLFYWFCFFLEKFCCTRDLNKKPYTESDLGRPALCIFVFGLVAIGAIVYGFIVASGFEDMNNKLKCATIAVMDEVVDGASVGSYEWIGIQNAKEPIDDIIDGLSEVGNASDTHFGDTTWIEQELEQLFASNKANYEYYKDKEVASNPNPQKTSSVESLYITSQLGDTEMEYTSTNIIKLSLESITQAFANVALNIVQSSSDIKLNIESMKSALQVGQSNIQSTADQFNNQITQTEKQMQDIDGYNSTLNSLLVVFFGAQLLGASLAFLGVSFTHCTGPRPKCRVLLHLGWFIMSIMMIIGLVLSVILMPTGVMLTETCSWMSEFLQDEQEFNDPSYTFLDADLMKKISVCKFGDGNLSNEFSINEELAMVDALISSLAEIKNVSDSENDDYINLEDSVAAIQAQITRVDNIKNGTVEDSQEITDDNGMVALVSFRSYADYSQTDNKQQDLGGSSCTKFQDQYVFDASQCDDGYTLFESGDASNTNAGSKTCIPINNIDLLTQASRYSGQFTGCTNQAQIEQGLQNYYLSILQYDIARRSLFLSISEDFTDLKTDTSDYHTKLNDFVTDSATFSDDIAKLVAATNDPKTGLLSRFNCKFLGNSIDRVYDALCVAWVAPVFQAVISTALASVSMFFATFFSFILAIRYARKDRPQKQKIKPIKTVPKKESAKDVKRSSAKKSTITQKKLAKKKVAKK